jgi:hypothetical protein
MVVIIALPDETGRIEVVFLYSFPPRAQNQRPVRSNDATEGCGTFDIAFKMDDEMDVVGHDYEFVERETFKTLRQLLPGCFQKGA